MRKYLLSGAAAAAAVLLLVGCQTAKPATSQQSMIQADVSGFAPAAPAGRNTISFSLSFGNSAAVTSWSVQVAGPSGAVKTFTGDGKNIPGTLTWDGKNDSGMVVPEGSYTASLSIDYAGKLPKATAVSGSFMVDVSPPVGALAVNPSELTPGAQGMTSPVTFTVDASSYAAKITEWTIRIYDSNGALFQTLNGTWPDRTVSWDGKGASGQYAQPSMTYSAIATITDAYGLDGIARVNLPVSATAAQEQMAPEKVPAEQNAIQAGLNGFSPRSENGHKDIQLFLTFGNPTTVKSWTVSLTGSTGRAEKTFTGDAANLPTALTWDGRDESGHFAPDGTYTASLAVDDGAGSTPSAVMSRPFILDVTPPSGSVALSEKLFSPEEASKTITLTVDASSPVAKLDAWTMNIVSPEGTVFRTFQGTWPEKTATWDGKSASGALVESAETYPVRVTVTDQFGNVGTLSGKVPVGILVFNTPEGYRIQSSRIFFKPYTADYRDVAPDIARQNEARLDALAEKLKKFPADKIKIIGHAVMIYWDNPTLGKAEQQDVLIPLSQARAKAIEQALMDRGLRPAMFTTDGVGAADQIVPDSNLKERWENRRVALFLEK